MRKLHNCWAVQMTWWIGMAGSNNKLICTLLFPTNFPLHWCMTFLALLCKHCCQKLTFCSNLKNRELSCWLSNSLSRPEPSSSQLLILQRSRQDKIPNQSSPKESSKTVPVSPGADSATLLNYTELFLVVLHLAPLFFMGKCRTHHKTCATV